MDQDYLDAHPQLEKRVDRIAKEYPATGWYETEFFKFLYRLRMDTLQAFQYIYRSHRDIYKVIDFILWLRKE